MSRPHEVYKRYKARQYDIFNKSYCTAYVGYRNWHKLKPRPADLTFTPPESFPSSQFWGIYALIEGVRVKLARVNLIPSSDDFKRWHRAYSWISLRDFKRFTFSADSVELEQGLVSESIFLIFGYHHIWAGAYTLKSVARSRPRIIGILAPFFIMLFWGAWSPRLRHRL